ncbi:MAG: GspE/PulE family protein [Pirellulaceae bacterium]|nr:GspE/PulE family protein [Pirellulaceae bacterium]
MTNDLLNLDEVRVDPLWAMKVPSTLALRRQVLPFAAVDGRVYVACANAEDRAALEAVERCVGLPVCPQAAEPASLRRTLNRVFGPGTQTAPAAPARARSGEASGDESGEDAVALCDELMHAALVRQASDIHIDPEEKHVQIRLRVDGVLERYRTFPTTALSGVISRFKVLGGMDIAEKRAPQDGGFTHRFGQTNQAIDVRLASLPTKYGERMTVRLLALQTESLTLERLGMSQRDLASFSNAIDKPHGLILLTGPTGSGKTTTLYAALRRLIAGQELNVITIEDPIEYGIAGVAQVEVDTADKVTFGKALRSVLRHDPDVVMIGEIRDAETADVAIKAALTGHLVFSTLHTNSACSAVTRLVDMGVQRYLIAATLRLAVAQRLVRRLCARCRRQRELLPSEAAALGNPDAAGQVVYEPAGCLYCANRGLVGRLGLFELLPVDESVSRHIVDGADEAALAGEIRRRGIPRLVDDALSKLYEGQTTVQEVLTAVTVW